MRPVRSSESTVPARVRPFRGAVRAGFALACAVFASTALADDGDPDPTFGSAGRSLLAWPTTALGQEIIDVRGAVVAQLRDGRYVAASTVQTIGDDRFQATGLVRFGSDGAIDTTFGTDGWRIVSFEADPQQEDTIAVLPAAAGAVVVVGTVNSMSIPYQTPALLKLRVDGSLDPNFGIGGRAVIHDTPADSALHFNGAIQDAQGRIVLFGTCQNCGHGSFVDFFAMRVGANGALDDSFGNDGWASFGRFDDDQHWLPEEATAAAIDTQGRLVLGGYAERYDDSSHQQIPLLVRTTPDGELDTTFGATGYVDVPLVGSLAIAALAIDAYNDGVVFAANITNTASVTPGSLLVRVRRDGVVDPNFGDGGAVVLQLEEGTNVTALAIRSDRRITAAGWIDPNGADTRDFFAARTIYNGSLDPSFDGNGVNRYTFPFASQSLDVPTAMILSGERPVIAGLLVDPAGGPQAFATALLRLQSDLIFEDGIE